MPRNRSEKDVKPHVRQMIEFALLCERLGLGADARYEAWQKLSQIAKHELRDLRPYTFTVLSDFIFKTYGRG